MNEMIDREKRLELKDACIDMVRKDFEIIRMTKKMSDLGGDFQFYSDFKDELSSIEHCFKIAYSRQFHLLNQNYVNLIQEMAIDMANNFKGGDELKVIQENAKKLVDLVFICSDGLSDDELNELYRGAFELLFGEEYEKYIK